MHTSRSSEPQTASTREEKKTRFIGRFTDWASRHPVLAIALMSLAVVAINCYPVIFCGKSYVAPALGVPMLYERYPTLPGMTNEEPVYAHGSDTAATLV
jgi:hypothetical protein